MSSIDVDKLRAGTPGVETISGSVLMCNRVHEMGPSGKYSSVAPDKFRDSTPPVASISGYVAKCTLGGM